MTTVFLNSYGLVWTETFDTSSNSSAVVWAGLKLGLLMEFIEGGLHEADQLQAASA